ncbi:AAA domain-containing protein [Halospina denitrificans]|uniref:AAA domain-containing protein n=1 Tax=Halospina denitrificans TaxID=332522 RepID=UPI00105FFF68|nr:AAA domain-containing protein [Halospina denitrificans]
MALLHYQNLGVGRPDVLMKKAFFGLKTFNDFLNQTKKYMESDAALVRLAWKDGLPPGSKSSDSSQEKQGIWIQLEEPRDRPNEPESSFRAFMDENNREVFAVEVAEDEEKRAFGPNAFRKNNSIQVIDRDVENYQLLLEHRPSSSQLILKPETYTLRRQLEALRRLQDSPSNAHVPILRLFESLDHAEWLPLIQESVGNWRVLTDETREGTDEQRQFVNIALATPDFAFLEGPPGSGKTTAICELILESVSRGHRVLLCASTHVAVDNVLERLMDEQNPHRDMMIPVRVGDSSRISEKARPWQLDTFVKTERRRLLSKLRETVPRTESQEALLDTLRHGNSDIERMVLDSANLVCGTTIGILQHPDIKNQRQHSAHFDTLIVDEASKTTFQEFLVPALLAKRWVIVGDPKQLSPYVDGAALACNIETCLPDNVAREACVDVFLATHRNLNKHRVAVVASNSEADKNKYLSQAQANDVNIAGASDGEAPFSSIILDSESELETHFDNLPLDTKTVRARPAALNPLRRQVSAWKRINREEKVTELPEWSEELSWRLASLYEQRFAEDPESGVRSKTAGKYRGEIVNLLPAGDLASEWKSVPEAINRIRRVALPSILESLRHGFDRDQQQKHGTALSDGLPADVLASRHVLLSTQHRMHDEIAEFSRSYIYQGKALQTPVDMTNRRNWGYSRHAHRALWLEVNSRFQRKTNSNPGEAKTVLDEITAFDHWAKQNPPPDKAPWVVAVLAFYRGQEREIRNHLQRWSGMRGKTRHFHRGDKQKPYLEIELCTVDRFQGHEADMVLISLANDHPTSFLESPNRLNVALTRARYQRIVIGNRKAMRKAKQSVLGTFAGTEVWGLPGGGH